tara:strand:+ start:3289 stop:4851 length:1563 start_codon:yes stop_codon:yes gene_type:complete
MSDELKKLFEAIAQEKIRTKKKREEETLAEAKKAEKKKQDSQKVQGDFWEIFTTQLKALSEEETKQKSEVEKLNEIKDGFKELDPSRYIIEKEVIEEVPVVEEPDLLAEIDTEKLAQEFKVDLDPKPVVEDTPKVYGDPDIDDLERKVNALELKYAGVIKPQEEVKPEDVWEEKTEVKNELEAVQQSAYDVLSLTPTEAKNTDERSLQEMAVSYITSKKEELKEEKDEIGSLKKQIVDINTNIRQMILGMQGIGGGGEVRLEFLDDIDRATAKVNNKFLMYDSTLKKWKGVDAHEESGLDRVTSHVIPSADDTYDLGSSTLRWRDIYTSGSTIDIGGMKLQNDGSHNLEIKDGSGNKQAISANIAFSDITSKPTTVAGYGISDAVSSSAIANFITLSSISVGSNASASGSGGIAYNNSTGVFTYTPPAIDNFITLTSISMASNASASGTGGVAYNNSNGQFTYTPPDLSTYATLASPALTGAPTAPTAASGSDDTKIATTAFVQQEIAVLKALLYAYNQS